MTDARDAITQGLSEWLSGEAPDAEEKILAALAAAGLVIVDQGAIAAARDEGRIEGAAVGVADLEAAERQGKELSAAIIGCSPITGGQEE